MQSEYESQFTSLWMAAEPSVRRMLFSMAQNETDIDDLCQTTFVKAFENRLHFRPGTNFSAWVKKIAYNELIGRIRQDIRRHMADIAESPEPSYTMPQSDYMMIERLHEELAGLPDEYSSVLLLLATTDIAYKEIAAKLGIPVGTVMSRVSRGRKRMKERLKNARWFKVAFDSQAA